MNIKKSLLITVVITLLVILSIVALPVSIAMAYSDGPFEAGVGSNVTGIGSEPWISPGEITLPGSPYASVLLYHLHTASNYIQGTDYGFNVPFDAAITGIEVSITRIASGNNPSISDNEVKLVKGGAIVGLNHAYADAWPKDALAVATYGGPTDLWGVEWTPDDVNSPDFGAVLAAARDNNGNNDRYAYVDTIQITVYYTYRTTTTVACAGPVVYGDSVLCTATVSRIGSNQTPTGVVDWTSDTGGTFDPIQCTLEGAVGTASCSVTYMPDMVGSGLHLLTAMYAGDNYFEASNGTTEEIVLPRPVTVTAYPQTKVYGDPDPELTYYISEGSLVFNDTFTDALTRMPGEDVGAYLILQGTLALSENYNLTYVGDYLTIVPADAVCDVTPYSVIYDANPHTATGACYGLLGEPLDGLDLSGTTHTDAGTYIDTWFYNDMTGNYNDQSGQVQDFIDRTDAVCAVTSYDVVYDGIEHTAEGECTGVLGEPLVGLDLSGTSHTDAGTYTDPWVFTDATGNYFTQEGTVVDNITKTDAVCVVLGYDVVYDGTEHMADGTCTGVLGEPLEGLDLSGTAHTDAGSYLLDPWVFTDVTGNYENQAGSVDDNIGKADPTCEVVAYTLEYDRDPHTATGACTGVLGEPLDELDLSGTTHTDIGMYLDDPWVFTDGTGNYTDMNGTVNDEITLRFITVTADAVSKFLGQVDPPLTYQVTTGSLLSGDNFMGELTREPGEHIGSYAILQGTLSLAEYYQLTFVSAEFTITGMRHYLPIVSTTN